MDNKSDFVLASIADIQSTIRAIDVKVAALLVGILAPLASIGRVFSHIVNFCHYSESIFFVIVSAIFLVTWVLALISLVRAIGAIDNPAAHITNACDYKGTFYADGLFKIGILDVFFNRDSVAASKDPKAFSQTLPKNKTEIESELIYEQMKLIYIRDTKILRFNWGLRFAFVWLVLGITIYLCSRLLFK